MMALDLDMLKQIAAKSNYPEYGISGRINYVTEKGKKQIGISGNKANHADLTVELGFSSDLGVTNDRFPHEVGEGYPPVGMWMILRFFKESNFSIKRNVIYAM